MHLHQEHMHIPIIECGIVTRFRDPLSVQPIKNPTLSIQKMYPWKRIFLKMKIWLMKKRQMENASILPSSLILKKTQLILHLVVDGDIFAERKIEPMIESAGDWMEVSFKIYSRKWFFDPFKNLFKMIFLANGRQTAQ